MVLRGMAIDAYVVMYHNYAGEMVCHMVHSHLEDILDIFNLKEICRNLYLPQWILALVIYEDLLSKWMLQKPSLVLSLLKHVA